jgi:hypothetical protein
MLGQVRKSSGWTRLGLVRPFKSCYYRLGLVSGRDKLFMFLQVSSVKFMSGHVNSGYLKLDQVMSG